MGRIAWDEIHFIVALLIALFILQWVKMHVNEEGSTYKSLAWLKGV